MYIGLLTAWSVGRVSSSYWNFYKNNTNMIENVWRTAVRWDCGHSMQHLLDFLLYLCVMILTG